MGRELGIMTKLTKRMRLFMQIILIIVAGFIVYSNSLNGKFIWDDYGLVKNNTHIKHWAGLTKVFKKDITAGYGSKSNFYRPLQMLTYMVDYSFWKLNVIGYHLSNILWHIMAALCIYWLINIIFKTEFISLITSITFVIHPVHTEVVSYISGRADSLAAVFTLLCLILYIKQAQSKTKSLYILMLLCCVLALLSRENSLILPALLLLYHYAFKQKFNLKELFSILSITFIYILLRLFILKALLINTAANITLFQRLPGFFVAVANYIRILVLPFNLHMEYGKKLFKTNDREAVLGALALFLLLIYAFKKRKQNRLIFFAILWFFITLLPASNLYPVNAYMAEHWLYLPSLGFFLIWAMLLNYLYRTKGFKILTLCLVTGALAFYSYLTIRQNGYWKDPIFFYERTLEFTPVSSKLYNNLAEEYNSIGKKEKAAVLLKRAIEISSKNTIAYNNLGAIYSNMGKKNEAVDLFKKAIEIEPKYMAAYNNLVRAYWAIGKKEEAITLCKKAIEIEPDYADIYYTLGDIYANIGQKEAAIKAYQNAAEANPVFTDAYNNLCNEYIGIGENEEAVKYCKKAIQIDSAFSQAYYNLGNAYANIGKLGESIKAYREAIVTDPHYVEAYNNLAAVYTDIGKVDEAIVLWNKTIEINPNFAEAHFNLAKFYFQRKQYDLAIKHCDIVIRLGYEVDPIFLELLKPYRK